MQNVIDRFVAWTGRQPGIVQLGLWPCALAIMLLHLPFVLMYLLVSVVVDRVYPRELPALTRDELREWAHATCSKWTARHANLREHNPIDVADGIALPVIDALRAVADGLDRDDIDIDQLTHLAARLIDLPFTTAPDAHTIGLCIRRHLVSTRAN